MRIWSLFAAIGAFCLLPACVQQPVSNLSQITPATAPAEAKAPVTILVSIDGFRADYLDRGITPNLSKLAENGVSAAMRPSFPSKTFPNHWALVTGEYPDHNGITANSFTDPARPDEKFTMASDDPFWWEEAMPVWVAAEQAGIRTATMFWPGSNVAWGGTMATEWPHAITGGTRPSDWQQFSQQITGRQRVNAVLDWLRRPADIRPRFVTLYFDTVDTAGHANGPDDPRTNQAITDVDAHIGALVTGLVSLGQPANLIVVADHGMARISSEHVVPMDKIADPASYELVESGPYATLRPAPGKDAALARALLAQHPHMKCWRKGEMPARLHYGTNDRIPPYVCLAETGWSIAASAPDEPFVGGNHGFDPASPEMAALFVASGPAFRSGATLPPFDNVDVEPLLRRLLGLPENPRSDGDIAPLARALAPR